MVFPVNALSFRESPESFDQIQVRGIRGQEQEADAQLGSQTMDHFVALIPRVIKHDGDGSGHFFGSDLAKQFAHGIGVHHGGVGDGDQ